VGGKEERVYQERRESLSGTVTYKRGQYGIIRGRSKGSEGDRNGLHDARSLKRKEKKRKSRLPGCRRLGAFPNVSPTTLLIAFNGERERQRVCVQSHSMERERQRVCVHALVRKYA